MKLDMEKSTSNPLVSILIPTYNRSGLLVEAIKSAIAQTYDNTEIIVLDDCGKDNTPEVVKRFEGDSRFRYVRHEQNLGITGNWTWGISHAKGEFFCLLHDDDTLEPEFVEKTLSPLLDDPSLILAFTDHWVMDEHGKRSLEMSEEMTTGTGRSGLAAGKLTDFPRAALVTDSVPVGASLFRRSLVLPDFIDVRAKGAIDAWLFFRCAQTGSGAYYVKEKLMNYRQHGGGMSKSMMSYMNDGDIFRYESIYYGRDFPHIRKDIGGRLGVALASKAKHLTVEGKYSEARRVANRAMRFQFGKRILLIALLAYMGPLGERLLKRGR